MPSPTPSAFQLAVQAIDTGDVDTLVRLLAQSPELVRQRTSPPRCATLLHYTSFNGIEELSHAAPPATPDIARLLLQRGADADALAFDGSNGTSLCWALSSWFTFVGGVQNALVDAYLDGGAAIEGVLGDGAPLGHAIGFGYTPAVEHLARRGAFVDHVFAAAALGDLERLSAWFREGAFCPSALEFTRGEREETGRFSWPPPRAPEPTALALVTAATHGRVAVVRWLLESGVDPDASVSLDQTALHFAAYQGHAAVVKALLGAGARTDIRERQFQRTPAEWAEETDEHVLSALLEGERR